MTEVWKQVPFAIKYEASTYGRIRNIKTQRILIQYLNDKGYFIITLQKNNSNGGIRSINKTVHQIIARTFIENPENKPTVNHIDFNTKNNKLDNLEWMTMAEQNKHASNNILRKKYGEKLCRAVWKCDLKTGERITRYESVSKAALMLNNSISGKSSICAVCNKKVIFDKRLKKSYIPKMAYGFGWEYEEDISIEGEIWKNIDPKYIKGSIGFSISSKGRTKNCDGRIRSPWSSEYLWVSINSHNFLAHRIIALVFLENPFRKQYVNHIDGDKLNCSLSNLEWCTLSENTQHAVDMNLLNVKRKILQYDMDGNFINEYESRSKAQNVTGFVRINMKGVSSHNHQWRYVDDERPLKKIGKVLKQYDLYGNFIRDFNDTQEACNILDIKRIYVNNLSSRRFQWRYSNDYTPINNLKRY